MEAARLPQTLGKQLARSGTIWNKFLLWAKQHQSRSSVQPRTRRPKPPRFVTAVCGDKRPCKQSGLSGEHPIPRDSPAPTVFPHKGQPREGSSHVGRDHIPAAVGLGLTRMLSRGMSCQVLQVSWKWLDGCPQCSCTKGCRKIGDVPWRLLRNPTVKDLSLYTS